MTILEFISCGDSQRDIERDIERDSERNSGVVTSPWSTVSDMSGSSMMDSLHEDRPSSSAWARCECLDHLPAVIQREETVPEGDGPDREPDTSAPSWPDTDSDGEAEFEGWADSDFEDVVGSQSENEDECHNSDDILLKIVRELTTTEESYLKTIDILVQAYSKAMKIFKKENVRAMFPNIESIYHLHKEMLEAFKRRLATWETNRAIGDVMNKFAPHLKMYKEYVALFQTSEEAVTECMRASTVFAAAVQKITQGGKLGITAYMLGPIQRVPRYELLMKEFLKKLPADDDEERASVQKAIAAIQSAASCFQNAILDKDIFGGLLDIQKVLNRDVVSPGRKLVKKGTFMLASDIFGGLVKIQKVLDRNVVSPGRELVKKGTLTSVDRHRRLKRTVFLFNDELFVCRKGNTRRLGGGMGYNTQYQLPLKHMQVTEDERVEEPFLMLVRTRSHAIHFAFPSAEERLPWLLAFGQLLTEQLSSARATFNHSMAFWQLLTKQPSSLRQEKALDLIDEATPAQEKLSLLGRVAPVWVWDSEASMCMLCADDFAAFKRKHHCRRADVWCATSVRRAR